MSATHVVFLLLEVFFNFESSSREKKSEVWTFYALRRIFRQIFKYVFCFQTCFKNSINCINQSLTIEGMILISKFFLQHLSECCHAFKNERTKLLNREFFCQTFIVRKKQKNLMQITNVNFKHTVNYLKNPLRMIFFGVELVHLVICITEYQENWFNVT